MDETGMTPRITVPDHADRHLVQTALVNFAHVMIDGMACRDTVTESDLLFIVNLTDRSTALIELLAHECDGTARIDAAGKVM